MPARVALLASPTTYRGDAFLEAARKLGLDVLRVVDTPAALGTREHGNWLDLDFAAQGEAVAALRRVHEREPLAAVVALDDSATMLAAQIAAALNLPHNDPNAALAARNKWVMRKALERGGVPVPTYRQVALDDDPLPAALEIGFPVVVKPITLSGSRGVIRANDAGELRAAFARAREIALSAGPARGEDILLLERYLPGVEVALEGLLTAGALQTLAIFDKPDPLEGPFFEETIYVTPSRLAPEVQDAISSRTAEAAAAHQRRGCLADRDGRSLDRRVVLNRAGVRSRNQPRGDYPATCGGAGYAQQHGHGPRRRRDDDPDPQGWHPAQRVRHGRGGCRARSHRCGDHGATASATGAAPGGRKLPRLHLRARDND
jgi:hypothetical protein